MALNKIFGLSFKAQDWANRRLLLIIDEAQGSYSYTPLWNDLIKGLSPDAGPLVALFSSYGSPSWKPLEQSTPTPILFTHAQRVSLKPSPPENPDIGFIGCEPFVNGIAKALSAIETLGLTNIRLYAGNAADLIGWLPSSSLGCVLGRVFLFFPDPWPKRRQRKRRFVSDENLATLAQVMRSDAELRFATDIDDYAGWTLARILRSPDFVWPTDQSADCPPAMVTAPLAGETLKGPLTV